MTEPIKAPTRRARTLALAVAIFTLTFALSPLATIGFAGFSPGQFPVPQTRPPVQPAGYAFSIWGVIYLWLIIGAGYGFWRAAEDADWQAMRPPLAISLIIGTFWTAAANASPVLATLMIFAMAVAAIMAMRRAGRSQPWLQIRPVALYAGWLTAATGVAIGVLLGGYGILSAQTAAIICLVGVLAVALLVQSSRPDEWGYAAAVVWALTGVIAANLSGPNMPGANLPGPNLQVIALAALGIAALILRAVQAGMKGASE